MTDERDNQSLDREERAIEQALSQAMATGSEPRLVQGGEGADAELVREYTELLGLLPYELEPETPSAGLKDQILNRVRGAANASPAAAAARSETVETFPTAPATPVPTPMMPAATAAAPRSWSQLALAAAFAVCLLGLGFTGGLVWQQGQKIDELNRQLALVPPSPQPNPLLQGQMLQQGEMLQAQQELATLRDRLNMITVIARQAYPMRRVSHQAVRQGAAEGIVYVCGQHQRWYLHLQGLEPPAEGEEYRLWFMTDEGKVDGGVLDVGQNRSIDKDAVSMPLGVKGFAVTRERIGPQSEPESLTILLGEQAINL